MTPADPRAAAETGCRDVMLVEVLQVWHKWRKTLPTDRAFTHSDGLRFVQALDDLLVPAPPEPQNGETT